MQLNWILYYSLGEFCTSLRKGKLRYPFSSVSELNRVKKIKMFPTRYPTAGISHLKIVGLKDRRQCSQQQIRQSNNCFMLPNTDMVKRYYWSLHYLIIRCASACSTNRHIIVHDLTLVDDLLAADAAVNSHTHPADDLFVGCRELHFYNLHQFIDRHDLVAV